MANIVREDIDALNATLHITIEPSDYQEEIEKQLKRYTKEAQLKGFRKGQTPASVIRKMYGKSILMDVLTKSWQKTLTDYIIEENLPMLGQPLMSDKQQDLDPTLREMKDYVFSFDLGLKPSIELPADDTFTDFKAYEVVITEEQVDAEVATIQEMASISASVTDSTQPNDFIRFKLTELENGQPRENGVVHETSLLLDKLDELPARKAFLGENIGSKVVLEDVYALESEDRPMMVTKYLLNITEEEADNVLSTFEAEILEINRKQPAALDQKLFDKVLGEGTVNDLAGFREELRTYMKESYKPAISSLVLKEVYEQLPAQLNIPLPDEFLKRWLVATSEKVDDLSIDKDYPGFADSLRWSIVRDKLAARYGVKIEQGEVENYFYSQLQRIFGNSPYMTEDLANSYIERSMQDENQVSQAQEDILTSKLGLALYANLPLQKQPIGKEAFEALMDELRGKNNNIDEEE